MTMRCILGALVAVLLSAAPVVGETMTFDGQPPGGPPAGFSVALTGRGPPPVWVVERAPDGQAGNVVVQRSNERSSNRFPLLVADRITAADLDVSVKFRAVDGSIDQAAGLVWRYRDANNYYIVRANALEDNVVLYKVEKGVRTDLPVKGQGRTYGGKAPVPKLTWNTLAVAVRGNLFAVTLNGVKLYEVEDETFKTPGKVGLWTKADSVTMFDDLDVTVVK